MAVYVAAMIFLRGAGAVTLLLAVISCVRPSVESPVPAGGVRTRLPAVPRVEGPLGLRVVYPPAGTLVNVRDSSFLLGTTGTGDAELTVNGVPVRVWPNGAWLAWLPFPADSVMQFTVVARTPRDSVSLVHVLYRPARFVAPPAGPWVDSTSLSPRGPVWIRPGEYLPLSVRASPGASVQLRLADGTAVPLVHDRGERYAGVIRGRPLGPDPGPILPLMPALARAEPARAATSHCAAPSPCDVAAGAAPVAAPDTAYPMLEAIQGTDTARVPWPLQLALVDTLPILAELDDDPLGRGGTDSITVGRAALGGSYHWFFPTGTVVNVTGRIGDQLRVRLAPGLEAWVAAADARPLPPGLPPVRPTVGSVALSSRGDAAIVRIPVGRRVPFRVEAEERRLSVTLYGAAGDVDWIRYDSAQAVVHRVSWSQRAPDAMVLDVALAAPLWGYRTRWHSADLLLEIRRPPQTGGSLEGMLVAIDPGHPPAGATGPTGLTEAEANLAVAERLRDFLVEAGARVVLTRATPDPLDLTSRVRFADSVGADLLVSIHNNAVPDGVNPFTNQGTTVFYNHPPSLPLARAIQRRLREQLGLPDLGVARGDLALVRPTWMPAVLCEGLFMIMPDHEAALRSEEGRERYARGVFQGIRDFVREVGAER